ncbi:MAG TPA: pyrroloquinoline quinone biosynthesis protein PqqB [Pirellulales bacterium]|jgi:pyrroloquinoline quinone biosynthesis protein B|nr:pyrroloquinoline quinone biosynthesis protein PqqB [Pirellulales bacterium]
MQVHVLGSAAGGGLPQWNCRCANCAAVRAGMPNVRPRTQSSVAVSPDGHAWFLLNVSPDIRQQIRSFAPLGPAEGTAPRGTAIAGCVLTDAELDHAAGLLLLREGGAGGIHCTATVRRWLNRWFPVEPILASFSNPSWCDLPLDAAVELCLPDGSPSGLRAQAFETGRHVPRYVNDVEDTAAGSVVGLRILETKTGARLVYAPCAGELDGPLVRAAAEANCLLVDGTFWDDDEPLRCGIGSRTSRAMGHVPVNGREGSLNWIGGLSARHRVYVHVNNTNPMLDESRPEHRLLSERGVRVGADGDHFEL